MRKFGLVGYPLGHSFSKKFFTNKFNDENIENCVYENFEIENIERVKDIVYEEKQLVGLNVTIPYKEKVMRFLDDLSEEASKIKAVNTIKITRKGNQIHLKGYNTDQYGFRVPLEEKLSESDHKALILGTGGASKAVAYTMNMLNIPYKYVSRTPKNKDMFAYGDLDKGVMQEYKLIVNTSPLGTYPNIEQCPDLPYEFLSPEHILYDLVYNPEKTKFLRNGQNYGAITINGLPMLQLQAEKAWEIWNTY